MPGERRRLARNPLHHVAVAAKSVNAVIEHRQPGSVERAGEPTRADRHADAVAATLPERPGRHFHARGVAIFRMAGATTAELPELFDVVEGHRRGVATFVLHAGQME